MYKIVMIGFLFFAGAGSLKADVLVWNQHPNPEVNYRVHIGTAHRVYDRTVDVGKELRWVSDIVEVGTFYFAVTAYIEGKEESAYSYELAKEIVLLPPEQVKFIPDNNFVAEGG